MRLCTLNVHNWSDARGHGNASRVERLLAPLACDVVALQEVSRGAELPRVAVGLGMHVVQAPAGWASNALLSRAAPRWTSAVELDARNSEMRSAALAELDTDAGPVVVAATHLAHYGERARVDQFEQLAGALLARGERCLVLGDLNALRPSDYGPRRWRSIADERERNRWEAPDDALTRLLDDAGWVDLVRLHVAGSPERYRDALGEPLPAHLASTCRFGTRIDYALASPTLAAALRVTAATVVATDVSDHRPVLVDVALRG